MCVFSCYFYQIPSMSIHFPSNFPCFKRDTWRSFLQASLIVPIVPNEQPVPTRSRHLLRSSSAWTSKPWTVRYRMGPHSWLSWLSPISRFIGKSHNVTIVKGDYKSTYNWGGTILYSLEYHIEIPQYLRIWFCDSSTTFEKSPDCWREQSSLEGVAD